MGHFFVYADSDKVMGINNGGVILVARRDKVDPIYQEASTAIAKSKNFSSISMLFYPSNYISQLDAIRNHKSEYAHEKQVYDEIRPRLYESYVNFRTKELINKTSPELIDSVLKIFFSTGSKLTHEFIADGEVLRIAEKPSGMNTFFTGKKIGETLGSCNLKKIKDIEVTEKQIMFFNGGDNFMSVTRDRCYSRN
jgi:hypothetical protein